ncbi:midnolin homolog [Contarinia nasturtii]|uniref:midnolin homolog n=1 Tax=Contarinia nasturtii TaxID=265458 RepID=UPI0012D4BE2E|nr:midnolin homolog [Contarinia nasturtii]
MDGSKIILLSNVETGLLAQRPENTVMQALESLNDSQENEFLSGKTPLNLSIRVGDHMMQIQLQLSTVNPTNSNASTSTGSTGSVNSSRKRSIFRLKTSSSARPSSSSSLAQQSSSTNSTPIRFTNANHMYKSPSSDQIPEKYRNRHEVVLSPQASTSRASDLIESKNEFKELHTIVSSLSKEKTETKTINDADVDASMVSNEVDSFLEQSPIKSLSNLVSGPIKTSLLQNIPMNTPTTSNNLTSCPCKSVESSSSSSSGCDINCQYSRTRHQIQHKKYINHTELKTTTTTTTTATRSSALLHKTLNNPIAKVKSSGSQAIQSSAQAAADASNLRCSKSSESISHAEQGIAKMVTAKSLQSELSVDQPINIIDTTAGNSLDTVSDTLAEASRNLAKTVRKLSKEVFSSKGDASAIAINDEKRTRSNNTPTNSSSGSHQSGAVAGFGSGAVIESMRNHGRGIYSGTFSGTLNPALQDRYGRPKRDISTAIHILNDLLSATPHYSRGARISFEPAHHSRKYSSSTSKRISSTSAGSAQSHQQRSHCSKCTMSSSKSGCNGECIKASRSTSRHIYVTNDSVQSSKSASLPSTPISTNRSIDCRQCQMPMSSSAPVTPAVSPNQSLNSSTS